MSQYRPPHLCETMRRSLEDREMPVEYSDRLREYTLRSDDGSIQQGMDFCPFCGAELPVSVRNEFVRRLRAMGLDPWEDERPPAYRTGAWWRNDPKFDNPRDDGYAISPIDLRHFVLAMGLDGPVAMYTILSQAQELTGNVFLVPSAALVALEEMLRAGEIAAIRDARDPGGRWAGQAALIADRLADLLADDGPAMGAMIPGLEDYEIVNAISVEVSTSTRAEAEAWVAENRQLWDMVLADNK